MEAERAVPARAVDLHDERVGHPEEDDERRRRVAAAAEQQEGQHEGRARQGVAGDALGGHVVPQCELGELEAQAELDAAHRQSGTTAASQSTGAGDGEEQHDDADRKASPEEDARASFWVMTMTAIAFKGWTGIGRP